MKVIRRMEVVDLLRRVTLDLLVRGKTRVKDIDTFVRNEVQDVRYVGRQDKNGLASGDGLLVKDEWYEELVH